jgi:DNA-binding MarR family transcriptional regulator
MRRVTCALPVGVVDPLALGRCAWETERTERDVELLAWIGRFRFVTAQAIAGRFGFSRQQANAHVRRFERHGLVGHEREHVSQSRAVFLTRHGHELLGWPRRRPPRPQVQREHEDAIVWLATGLELQAGPGGRVLTERECRQLEAAGGPRRFSVEVPGGPRGVQRRWPDLVVEADDGRRAYEIEFAPKGTDRLRRIVAAYERSDYAEVVFLVKSAALARRIAGLTGQPSELRTLLRISSCPIRVLPWPALATEHRHELAAALGGGHASSLHGSLC